MEKSMGKRMRRTRAAYRTRKNPMSAEGERNRQA